MLGWGGGVDGSSKVVKEVSSEVSSVMLMNNGYLVTCGTCVWCRRRLLEVGRYLPSLVSR